MSLITLLLPMGTEGDFHSTPFLLHCSYVQNQDKTVNTAQIFEGKRKKVQENFKLHLAPFRYLVDWEKYHFYLSLQTIFKLCYAHIYHTFNQNLCKKRKVT